jgi:hypothetical protein
VNKLLRLSMLDVDHPELFEIYDASFKLAPQIILESWEFQSPRQSKEAKAYTAGLSYDAIATLHSIIGQFQVSLGVGGIAGSASYENQSERQVGLLLTTRLSWIVFLNPNFFLAASAARYKTPDEFLDIVNEIQTTSLQLGYYFPELNSLLKSFL